MQFALGAAGAAWAGSLFAGSDFTDKWDGLWEASEGHQPEAQTGGGGEGSDLAGIGPVAVMAVSAGMAWAVRDELRSGLKYIFDKLDERAMRQAEAAEQSRVAKNEAKSSYVGFGPMPPGEKETDEEKLERIIRTAEMDEEDRIRAEKALRALTLKNKFMATGSTLPPPKDPVPFSAAPQSPW